MKLTGPLMSLGAKGQLGKTFVTGSWRGVPYARQYVTPKNPNTTSQGRTRGVFSWLSAVWKLLDADVQAAWTAFAKGKPFTDRNAWVQQNLANLRGTDSVPVTVVTALITSPGFNAGLAAAGLVTADHGDHTLDVTLTAPTLPTGWAITKAHFIAIKQQDAHSDVNYTTYYASDAAAPYSQNIAGFGAGTYVASAFFEYTKPDGSTAYSPSISGAQVVA